ncbi:MAG TPA: GNAT family N-acetyltransferase [Ilumatobacteraceae bacterium]|nr:GNAT family N-acetyltransferase [Ilumatobacteraceae bacterium]
MMSVRRIEPTDAAALRRVRLAALLDEPAAFGSTYELESVRTDEDWAQRAAAGSAGSQQVTFFGDIDGELVGLVGAYRDAPASGCVHLVSMWVAPSARRQGIGRHLIASVVTWAHGTNATDVSLWVTKGNAAAEDLYKAAGFAPTGEVQPLPSDPRRDEIEFALYLKYIGRPAR